MPKKKVSSVATEKRGNPDWKVSDSYLYGKDLIVVGDRIKIKGERGEFKFLNHVVHITKKVEWIDCFNENGYRSFYVDRLKGKVKPKKFRRQ